MNDIAKILRRILFRDFFDFHAASGTGHENDASRGAVHEKAKIEFTLDVQPFLDQQALDDAARGAGLWSHQLHAENVAGDVRRLCGGARELDTSALAAAAAMAWRFDHANIGFQALRCLESFLLGESDFASRGSDAITREYRFGLVLVDFHEGSCASVQA